MALDTEGVNSMEEILLEFRAGRMFMEGTRVFPDSRKGLVRIGRGGEGLIHFQWLDRNQNTVVEDQIVFPDEAVFEKVSQSSERVYILKFKTDNRRFFFWMQESETNNGDLHICNLVNFHINQPFAEAVEEEEADASLPFLASEMSEDPPAEQEILSRAANINEPSLTSSSFGDSPLGPVQLADLQRILGNSFSVSAANTNEPSLSSSSLRHSPLGPVQLADLQRILGNIGSSDETSTHDDGLELGDILKPDFLLPLLDDLAIEEKLASYLPEGSWTQYEVVELLQSPQLRQQLEAFTTVLRSGQIDLSQFGINPSKYKFTVLSFLEALEDSITSSPEGEMDFGIGDNTDLESREPMDEGQ